MTGFTLPIWVVAAAKAAAQVLNGNFASLEQNIDFSGNQESIKIIIRSASSLQNGQKAIGICNCEPSECLDITRDLEIWVCLEYIKNDINNFTGQWAINSEKNLNIVPGYGVGKLLGTDQISISKFPSELLAFNLIPFFKEGFVLQVEVIFPCGRELSKRTSNHAFGVVDGLALIGTQAQVQVSASPDQLQNTIKSLRDIASKSNFLGSLIFVIGENGLNLALELGLPSSQIIKTGNWIGPLLVAAAQEEVKELLIFGYHGKLIKLAGGVFHTHHHLADNRLETLISLAVKEGIALSLIQELVDSASVEEALLKLEKKDIIAAKKLWARIVHEVEKRSFDYIQRYLSSSITVGAVMFDRKRQLRWAGQYGSKKINSLGWKLGD